MAKKIKSGPLRRMTGRSLNFGAFNQDLESEAFISPGRVIRQRRESLGLRPVELARKASVNPRTLDAIEKERVKVPSLPILVSLSKALGISVASFFVDGREMGRKTFHLGGQKGFYTLDFERYGFEIICHTPLVSECFIGKVILHGETTISSELLSFTGTVYAQPIIGKLVINFDGNEHLIREGNYAFFDGSFSHSYFNPQMKESSFLLMTVPSFLSRIKPD